MGLKRGPYIRRYESECPADARRYVYAAAILANVGQGRVEMRAIMIVAPTLEGATRIALEEARTGWPRGWDHACSVIQASDDILGKAGYTRIDG